MISRYLGGAVWAGVFLSLTILLMEWPKLAEVPGLPMRVLVSVAAISVLELVVGWLLFAGVFLPAP